MANRKTDAALILRTFFLVSSIFEVADIVAAKKIPIQSPKPLPLLQSFTSDPDERLSERLRELPQLVLRLFP